MKLIELKCKNCGAILKMREDSKQVKCEYCGAESILDDEIVKVEHHIKNDAWEEELTNAYAYLSKLRDYETAYNLYKELSIKKPLEPRIWSGLLLSKTENFESFNIGASKQEALDELAEIEKYFINYIRLEDNEKNKYEISTRYHDYKEIVDKQIKKKYVIPAIIITAVILLPIIGCLLIYILFSLS